MAACPPSLAEQFAQHLLRHYPRPVLERVARQARDQAYDGDPCGYVDQVLGQQWWAKQQEVARLLYTPPYRVLVKASHEVGKTHLAGGLVNHAYDSWDPGLVLTTAPTDTQVRDLLWKEVRVQRKKAGRVGFRGPKMPRLESAENHWAHGFTARDADAFQGRHEEHVLVIFDEAVGVAPEFWEAAWTCHTHWLAIFNPTDASSQAYAEERSGKWHVVTMNGLEHPNIAAELAGKPPPFPAALRLARLQERLDKWCTPIPAGDHKPGDIEWPPGSGKWLRPGPLAEARILGRWPSQAIDQVWAEAVWDLAGKLELKVPKVAPEIGCDVARFGDDFTEIHVRQGGCSLHHEAHNGWATGQTFGRLKQLAAQYARSVGMEPKRVAVKIGEDGLGAGLLDRGREEAWNFIGIQEGGTAIEPDRYPNRRSELWFAVADVAGQGLVSFARLDEATKRELRRQALGPRYTIDWQGRRVVEKKDETKKRIGRSPDGMDAVNNAYCVPPRAASGPSRVRTG